MRLTTILIVLTTLALSALFLGGCATEVVCPDGTVVSNAADCPIVETTPAGPAEPTEPAETKPVEPTPEPELAPTPEVLEFQEKAAKVKSYSFRYAELPENKARRQYFVKGDKIRVELFTPMVRPENSYDVIYLDPIKERAVAYCEQGPNTVCPDKTKLIERVDYDDYAIELPHEIIADLGYAEDGGSLTFDSHAATILEYENDEGYVRLTVQKFFGIPLAYEVYDNPDYEGEATGYQYRDAAFNAVTDEMVTPPSGW